MQFAANISILFQEFPFLERFARARDAGFSVVEFWWPSGEDLDAVEQAIRDTGLKVAVLNFDAGDMPAGDRGLVSDPERQDRFRDNVPIALRLARTVGCQQLNALVGTQLSGLSRETQLELACKNIAWAADQASQQGASILIEAVNTFENGPYLLHSTAQAKQFIERVDRDNVKLQYDVYHMQRMEGNLVATLRENIEAIAHIQIADSPGRGEPGTGEINYAYLFQQLEELGYDRYIGLEYRPSGGNTVESFWWLPQDGRSGTIKAGALHLP
jgi:hydroxypyruvate isomerase